MSRLNPRRHACFSRGGVFEYDDLTMHGNHNPHNARAGAPPCLGGSTHRWVPVDTHSTPVPERDGCGWLITTHKAQHTVQKHGKHFLHFLNFKLFYIFCTFLHFRFFRCFTLFTFFLQFLHFLHFYIFSFFYIFSCYTLHVTCYISIDIRKIDSYARMGILFFALAKEQTIESHARMGICSLVSRRNKD